MTSCVLCDAAAYPIEAAMAKTDIEYLTTDALATEFEYVRRQVAELEKITEGNASYSALIHHRYVHLIEEIDRRIKLKRYQPSHSAVSQDTIQEIKDRLPLERVIGQDLMLRKQGRLLLGHCPWHEDTQPSLTVYPDSHFFCYSCQTGGDVFDWLMAIGQRNFADALGAAAIMAGVELHPRLRVVER